MKCQNNKKIGLALSGGGYRAAAYHIGTLRALNRLGILDNIDVISSVSGGSITSAYYALNKDNYANFEHSFIEKLQKGVLWSAYINFALVVSLIILSIWFAGWWILLVDLLLLFLGGYKILPLSFWIMKLYDKYFFRGAKLSNFPVKPLIAINSTDVTTGTLFTFSQIKMCGYKYEGKHKKITFDHTQFPIAKAVMASSCVPFAFSPIRINERYCNELFSGERPLLIDGGLYDNQGAHKLSEQSSSYHTDYIIVSDAGANEINAKWAFNVPLMLVKTSDIMMKRIKTFQMRSNIYNKQNGNKYAYLSLGWEVSDRPMYGFVDNIAEGNVDPELYLLHHIDEADVENLKNGDKEVKRMAKERIIIELKKSIGWEELEQIKPTLDEHNTAKAVCTDLLGLSKKQINALIKHANWLTEVQVKLYLPYLITI